VTTELIARARSGDDEAFHQLIGPHRRELMVHCYRILGSTQDAEDALQETMLAAWQGLRGFEERSSVRTWLYRIATNRCLNALRSGRRRPRAGSPPPGVAPLEPTGVGEVPWLEPFPDVLLEGLAERRPARFEYHLTAAGRDLYPVIVTLMRGGRGGRRGGGQRSRRGRDPGCALRDDLDLAADTPLEAVQRPGVVVQREPVADEHVRVEDTVREQFRGPLEAV
jgi:RNA polymerase sigma factor (sigma-70 family)